MASRRLPSSMRQILVQTLGTNFRESTSIVDVPVPKPGAKDVLVKTRYVGINASDVNYTAGRYDPRLKPPFPAGFEGIGEVVQAGAETTFKEGQTVTYLLPGSFAEYVVVPSAQAVPVPSNDPAFMSIVLSGLTASISLEKKAELQEGETVLVTAAAGGTGQFAVQLAKLAGCHVIGTCSTKGKADFLKSIGCDRTVNYKEESLAEVLSKEYPKGVDVVYESIGQEMFDTALTNLAVNGRLIVIGQITEYQAETGNSYSSPVNVAMTVLRKSASVRGFFLLHFTADYGRHIARLSQYYAQGKLKVCVDKGGDKPFLGLAGVADAVEYMFQRKNIGKVVVELPADKSCL